MSTARIGWAVLPVVVSLTAVARGAELGDVNGDGRLSFADSYALAQWVESGGVPPAPGSADFEELFACSFFGTRDGEPYNGRNMPYLVLEESLRRLATSPLPHFRERWPGPAAPGATPPAADERVELELLETFHASDSSEVELEIRVSSEVDLDALSVFVRSPDLELRPPEPCRGCPRSILETSTQYFLLSGGEFIAYHSRLGRGLDLPAGETVFSLFARVPRGTPPGRYRIEVLPGTEVIAEGGELIVPRVLAGEFELDREIADGPVLPFPPFDLDDGSRAVGGGVEIAVDDERAEGFPGDEVSLIVRARVERPTNKIRFWIYFDNTSLALLEKTGLYSDPETGAGVSDVSIAGANRWGYIDIGFQTGFPGEPYPTHRDHQPSLRYIAPMDEWIDFAELRFLILDGAAGRGELPVRVDTNETNNNNEPPRFLPYVSPQDLANQPRECTSGGAPWRYEPTVLHNGRIRVLGGGEPVEPDPPIPSEIAAIRFELGEAAGRPGETVAVPVAFETGVDLWALRPVLTFDESELDFVGFEVSAIDADGAPFSSVLAPGSSALVNDICEGEGIERLCRPGLPWIGFLRGDHRGDFLPPGAVVADLLASTITGPHRRVWNAGTPYVIGAALFHIREDATARRVSIEGGRVEWQPVDTAGPIVSDSAGYPIIELLEGQRSDVPALTVEGGAVTIVREDAAFVRGDVNLDGQVNISDPMAALGYLFLGAEEPGCLDALDVDDRGSLDISDAISLLGTLFLGKGPIPAPYPACGPDETPDPLPCESAGPCAG